MEEVKFFEKGEHVFIVIILPTEKGNRFRQKSFIEAEYINTINNGNGYNFKVVRIISGSYFRLNKTYFIGRTAGKIFDTYEEAKQYWNSVIQDCIDKVTSFYQVSIKKLNKELLL